MRDREQEDPDTDRRLSELKGPPLGRAMLRDFRRWLGWRLLEASGLALALAIVALQSDSFAFTDYFGSASRVGWAVAFGWGIRVLASLEDDLRARSASHLALVGMFVTLFVAIVEIPAMAIASFPFYAIAFMLICVRPR